MSGKFFLAEDTSGRGDSCGGNFEDIDEGVGVSFLPSESMALATDSRSSSDWGLGVVSSSG